MSYGPTLDNAHDTDDAGLARRFAPTGQTQRMMGAAQPAPPPTRPAETHPLGSARVIYEEDGVEATVEAGRATLLEVSRKHKVPHVHECGGRGRCTTCRVEVLDGLGNLTERTEREIKLAAARGWGPNVRLACQACPLGDVRVRRSIRTPADVSLLQTEALKEDPGQEVEVAILSCDLKGFTAFADTHLPFDVVHVLNRVFASLGDSILLNNGVIYQYAGDQVIGLFGVDGTGTAQEHSMQAVRAGLGMIDLLGNLNASLADQFETEVDVRIGAHIGKLVVGYLGHPSRRVFSAIGDAMNVTCRVEAANKEVGTRFLITRDLFRHLVAKVETGRRAVVTLKGKREPHPLVEVRGFVHADADFLVQTTAQALLGAQSRFADVFYHRLFEAVPAARAMFGDDIEAQKRMLGQALHLAVYGLSRHEQVAPGLRALGRRHTAYGVTAAHYEVFMDVFVASAREVLGERFTPGIEQAWLAVLRRLSAAMQA